MNYLLKSIVFILIGCIFAGVLLVNPVNAADKLTVVGWGGAVTKAHEEAFFKPFTAKTGVEIIAETYNGGLAQVKAQVEAGKVTWDIIDAELHDAVRGCADGVLDEIDPAIFPPAPDGTPASKDFIPGGLTPCSVASSVWATVYAYDASKFPGQKPKTIADLFDTKKFPGKRGLRKSPRSNLEWALMADGVPLDQVYEVLSTPEGVKRALKMLDRIKDQVIWWEAGAQPPQMLADGEVTMTSAYSGRLYNAIAKEGQPFVIVWDGQVWDLSVFIVTKGSPRKDIALEFIKFATDTQRLADQTKFIPYGMARKSSLSLVGEKVKAFLPSSPKNLQNALRNDFEWWADYGDQMNEEFNNWLAK